MKRWLFAAGGAALLGVLSVRPYNARKSELRNLFKKKYIAHRGLFRNPDIPENSMAAFKNAVKHGYAIELDVQLAGDGALIVFHDDDLMRMCSDPRRVRDMDLNELQNFTLGDTSERIPLFKDVLDMVKGRVPLMVEVKPGGDYINAVKETTRLLSEYKGKYCIESFHPFVLYWLKRHYPEILRGQLSTDFKKDGDKHNALIQLGLTNMICNFLSRPDFISYNHKYSHNFSFQICARLFRSSNAAWTIKNRKQLRKAEKEFEFFIFDGFLPEKKQYNNS